MAETIRPTDDLGSGAREAGVLTAELPPASWSLMRLAG